MSAAGAQRPLLDELFDDLEKRYKSPTPETLALKARSFERLLHRYVLLLVGVNASLIAFLALLEQNQWPAGAGAGVAAALGGAALCALLASRSPPGDHWARGLFWGGAVVFVLLAGVAQPVPGIAIAVTIALAAATTTFVVAKEWPQGVVPILVLHQVLIWQVYPLEDDMVRMGTEALTLLPMLVVLAWRRLGVAATGAMLGIALVAALEAYAQDQSSALALSVLLGFFLVVGVVYEMRIQLHRHTTVREAARIGVPVLLIFLFVASLSKVLPGVEWGDAGPYWLAALLVALYQAIRIRRELRSLPLRLPWVAVCIVVAVLNDDRLGWFASQFVLLWVATLLHMIALKVRSRSLSNVAMVLVAGLALNSLLHSGDSVDVGVLVVAVVTFAILLAIAARPSWPPPQNADAAANARPGIARRIVLFVLGTLLRVPMVSWLFFWAKTAFVWLRYFRSATQPLGLNDLLFCAAHAYGATVLTLQAVRACSELELGRTQIVLLSILVPAAWGLALVALAPRADQLYRRMFGIVLMLVPACVQFAAGFADEAGVERTTRLAWIAIVMGAMICVSSWLVLRANRAEPVAPVPTDASG